MLRLNSCLPILALVCSHIVVAQGPQKIAVPSEEELQRPRELIEEIYPLTEDSDRDLMLHIIADMQSVADRNDTPSNDRYAIWLQVEALAIRTGEAKLWQSTIDNRLAMFAVEPWAANAQGLLEFAKSDPAAFAKSELVDRAVTLAQTRASLGSEEAEQAIAFLESIRKSSSRLATYREAMVKLADAVSRIENGDTNATTPASQSTVVDSRAMKRIQVMREKAAPDALKIDDHYYKAFRKEKITWPEAAEECRRMGGHLACLETDEEQQQVVAAVGQPIVLWLGGQILPNGKAMWINGVPIAQTVVNLEYDYKFVAFTREGKLNVRPQSGSAPFFVRHIKGYVCEWDH